MAIQVAITHKTVYRYDRLVELSPHVFRLRPAVHSRTPVMAYSFNLTPKKHFINWQQDPFGNFLARVVFPGKTRQLIVEVDIIAEMTVINPFDFFLDEYAHHYPFAYDSQLRRELTPYLEISDNGPRLNEWLKRVDRSEQGVVDFLVHLNQELANSVTYAIRMEPGVQTSEETLTTSVGSCRDTGWLLVQILRHLGFAARFVSGYLIQLKSDEPSLDGPSGPDQDFTDLHAWAEVYVPGAGWIGLDPTSGLFAGEGHIPLACTPDPVSAAPVSGSTSECECELKFHNTVKRIHEDPRVTKPYSEEQWSEILGLGEAVDREFENGDVRLTMGGEPTFVSVDDMDGPEWNTIADSPAKRLLAEHLIERLKRSFGPNGVLYYGQGKWYPGEQLPRWKYGCFWRKDGVPMWRNKQLLANSKTTDRYGVEHALEFITNLAQSLSVDNDHIVPGYEDSFYYLWMEGNIPVDIDPSKVDLKDPLERKYLADLLDADPGKPIGYALPIRWNANEKTWCSSQWNFRRQQMFLTPGGSPMGYRLPLESLPWIPPEKRESVNERSPFDTYTALTKDKRKQKDTDAPDDDAIKNDKKSDQNGQSSEQSETVAYTALTVELRDGKIHVFFPPLADLEHYIDLLSAVENTAEELEIAVVLEGYEPPNDPRIEKLMVTPDPGVIEVNIHPAGNWRDLVRNTTVLYDQAKLTRLCTEKFMLDGRHTGTGGGNHVIIGGATPSDSPLLRRPHLLRSLIAYWQIHPGLSYLFSGLFIGPTSQAPRVDEARNDNLYELEIAFSQIPDGDAPNFWLVDRLFRNLLTDLTGNTHRAEFCIDKLYSPNSEAGRLGLLELRAFEMPPHARMSLVQMLLLRILVAWFWKEPFRRKLIRWGTELHDRFMLPYYVWADIEDVARDIQRAGYAFCSDWLAPFYEFRFPHFGTVNVNDIEIELRMAIEPWNVLGEEVTRAGTARFVDSSVERLQIKVTGLTDSRHVICCNGYKIPLHNTGTRGEYVGGVRYRAWDPPSALHPTIGIHTPLVFDVVDSWNNRAIGGCKYNVTHGGGRNYDTLPVNAYEAEARRITRFWDHGHTPGTIYPRPAMSGSSSFEPRGSSTGPMADISYATDEEFPHTLDLRKTV